MMKMNNREEIYSYLKQYDREYSLAKNSEERDRIEIIFIQVLANSWWWIVLIDIFPSAPIVPLAHTSFSVRLPIKFLLESIPRPILVSANLSLAIDSANKEIEIWYFSILPKYRHSGNGTKYMEVLFKMINREFPNYSLMTRCKEKSKEMTKILHNFNFKAVSINKEDYVIYKLAKVSSWLN